jgi:hypothetical protein
MRERLIKLLEEADEYPAYQSYEGFADYLLNNGVVVLPCKVGDIVYQTDGIRIYELTILDILLRKNKPYYETDAVDFDDDAIGTSIFLSREEAERALRGGEGK